METVTEGILRGMQGLLLGQLRQRCSGGYWHGELRLQFDDGRWLLLWLPQSAEYKTWFKGGCFLMAETSGKPRRFARVDTALAVVRKSLGLNRVMVCFDSPEEAIAMSAFRDEEAPFR